MKGINLSRYWATTARGRCLPLTYISRRRRWKAVHRISSWSLCISQSCASSIRQIRSRQTLINCWGGGGDLNRAVINKSSAEGRNWAPTGCGRIRHHDCLKPHREEVHDSEIAHRNQEVGTSNQHWDALFKEKGGHDWLNRYKDFDYDESEGEHPWGADGNYARRMRPLQAHNKPISGVVVLIYAS